MNRRHDAPASVVQDGADAGAYGDSRVFGHADLLLFMSLQLSSPGSGPDWRGKGDASAAVPQASAEDTTPCGDRQALAPRPSLLLLFLFSSLLALARAGSSPVNPGTVSLHEKGRSHADSALENRNRFVQVQR